MEIEIENQVANIDQTVSEQVSFDVFDVQCKKIGRKMAYVQRECERAKQQMELMVKDLGQMIADKRPAIRTKISVSEPKFFYSKNSKSKCSSKCPLSNS